MQRVQGLTNANVSASPEGDGRKSLARSLSLRHIERGDSGIETAPSPATPASGASTAPKVKKRAVPPGVFAGHPLAQKVKDALATFAQREPGNSAGAAAREAADLLARWPDALEFTGQQARLSFALELAAFAPGTIILQHEKFSGWSVDWFAVYKNLARNFKSEIDPDALALLPELVTDNRERLKLVKSLMLICPEEARDLVCECSFTEKERLELALIYFSSPEIASTEDLDAFDLQSPQTRAAAALASLSAGEFDDSKLRKYILQIQPEEFALATLALAEMRMDQELGAGPGPLADGLLTEKIRMRFDRQEFREEFRAALKPLRQASSEKELRALLAEHADTLAALLGGKDIGTWDFNKAKDQRARLFGLRNLVFFIEISGLGVPPPEGENGANNPARADAIALLTRLGPGLLKIGAIVDAGLRMDLLDAIFNLPRRCLAGFAPDKIPVHIQPACLLLSPMRLTRLPRLLEIFSDEFKRDVFASRLLRLLLQLHTLDARVPNLEQLLELVTPGLRTHEEKRELDKARDEARAALEIFKLSANEDKEADRAKALELTQKLEKAKEEVQAFEKWKKETPNKILLALTRLSSLLESDPEAAAGVSSREALDTLHRTTVENAFDLTPDQYDRYLSVTDNWRDPTTLLVYYNRIKDTAALAPLQAFVQQLLAQDKALQFREKRYADVPILKSCSEQQREAWKLSIQEKFGEQLTLAFTDDPEDLVRMGSDFAGSCQKVDGLPVLNRALIGAVMDGREKLVVIKAKDGTIIGRAILRVMVSNPASPATAPEEGEGQVQLLMEKIYPLTLSRERKAALVNFALKQAERIGLPLNLSQAVLPSPSPNGAILHSGELEHILYSDAAGGLKAESFQVAYSTPMINELAADRAGALL